MLCFLLFGGKFDLNISANRIIPSVVIADWDIARQHQLLQFLLAPRSQIRFALHDLTHEASVYHFLHSKPR